MFTDTGISRDTLLASGRKLFRKNGKQILLIAHNDRIFAIANRCPHEGYPLSEGTLGETCVLTCNWHNWKFDLASGEALIGRDPVRTYPVELHEGRIFLDLRDPPADARKARALKGLEAALADNDIARMARETVRLVRAGFAQELALTHALRTVSNRFEDGITHAHAAAADWLTLSARAGDAERRLAALLEPLAHLAWDTQGAGQFPYPAESQAWDADAFVAACEAEDETRAIALVRGALAAGLSYKELRPAFARVALSHYADFGHSAIYTFKSGQLLERLNDPGAAEPVLLALARSLVRARREDLLPEFRFYPKVRASWNGADAAVQAEDFYGLSVDAALARTCQSSAQPPRAIYDALLGAAAFNLLYFDTARQDATDNAIADNIGWLDFTHALTFANALRHLAAEDESLWPAGLLQLAMFVGRNKKYVRAGQDVSHYSVNDRDAFLAREMATLYDHGIVEPIIACHRLKVLFALEDELRAAPDAPWESQMCAAVNRYLHIPMKRHNGLRNATQALDFIAREG